MGDLIDTVLAIRVALYIWSRTGVGFYPMEFLEHKKVSRRV